MFRNSSAGYTLRPGYSQASLQQAIALVDQSQEPSHVTSGSYVSQSLDTALSGQYSQQEQQDHRKAEESVSGSAVSYRFQEADMETSGHSHHTAQHSQTGSVANTDGRTRQSSSARWLQQPHSPDNSPEAASSAYGDPNVTGFSMFGQGLSPGSPHHVSSAYDDPDVTGFSMFGQGVNNESPDHASASQGTQDHAEIADSEAHYSWSVQSQSYAGSAASPGRDSLHSWTDSTPIKVPAPQDPASPDARTILRSIARECQNAVEGKSPVVRKASDLSPESRPDLSRTPNTFFNPSFDVDELSK